MQDGFGTGGMSAESMWECSLSLDNRVDLNMFLHFNRYVEGLAGEKRYLRDWDDADDGKGRCDCCSCRSFCSFIFHSCWICICTVWPLA